MFYILTGVRQGCILSPLESTKESQTCFTSSLVYDKDVYCPLSFLGCIECMKCWVLHSFLWRLECINLVPDRGWRGRACCSVYIVHVLSTLLRCIGLIVELDNAAETKGRDAGKAQKSNSVRNSSSFHGSDPTPRDQVDALFLPMFAVSVSLSVTRHKSGAAGAVYAACRVHGVIPCSLRQMPLASLFFCHRLLNEENSWLTRLWHHMGNRKQQMLTLPTTQHLSVTHQQHECHMTTELQGKLDYGSAQEVCVSGSGTHAEAKSVDSERARWRQLVAQCPNRDRRT